VVGKLKTERLVPVDPFVCKFVHRLRFFRSLERLPDDGFLLPRPRSKEALIRELRDYLHQVCHEIGLSTRIVPHQFRRMYASEMLRAGVGLPAADEFTRSRRSRHDHALPGRDVDRSETGIPTGALKTATSDTPAEGFLQPAANRPQRASSMRSSVPNTPWECFAAPCQTAPPAPASIDSRIDSQKSSPKQSASGQLESGQRLAGKARHSEIVRLITSASPDFRDTAFEEPVPAARGTLPPTRLLRPIMMPAQMQFADYWLVKGACTDWTGEVAFQPANRLIRDRLRSISHSDHD
jgi:hypothetical protein